MTNDCDEAHHFSKGWFGRDQRSDAIVPSAVTFGRSSACLGLVSEASIHVLSSIADPIDTSWSAAIAFARARMRRN